jgi:hypothetical protein
MSSHRCCMCAHKIIFTATTLPLLHLPFGRDFDTMLQHRIMNVCSLVLIDGAIVKQRCSLVIGGEDASWWHLPPALPPHPPTHT